MAAKTFLRTGTGNELFDEVAGVVTSAGAGNDGDIPALDAAGRLDTSVMPVGIGADTASVLASDNLAAGDLVNLWNNAGVVNARKADATTTGKQADGFVTAVATIGNPAVVFFDGTNALVTGLTVGKQWLSTVAGKSTATRPVASGNVQQPVGYATSATSLTFNVGETIKVA